MKAILPKLPGCHLSQTHLLCWKKSLVVFQPYPQVTFQLRSMKIQSSLVFYTSWRTEDGPPTRKNSKRQRLYDRFYMNGIDCFFQKMEFSVINLDLIRNQIVLPKKYRKRVYEEVHENMGHLGGRQSNRAGQRALLLAIHEGRYHSLCHKSMPVSETAENSSRCLCSTLAYHLYWALSACLYELCSPRTKLWWIPIYTCDHGPLHKICPSIRYA